MCPLTRCRIYLLLWWTTWTLECLLAVKDESHSGPCWNRVGSVWKLLDPSRAEQAELRPLLTEMKTTRAVENILLQVNASSGDVAKLPCRVRQLGNRTVSWLRHYGDSVHLLTTGSMVYTNNNRFSIEYRYPGNWTLKINHIRLEDSGCYQCQVNTHPPIGVFVLLHMEGPVVAIVDHRNESISEASFETASLIQLICLVRGIKGTTGLTLLWKHGPNTLNHDTKRGGISVKTVREASLIISWLYVARPGFDDSGIYTCDVGGKNQAEVYVHIVQGESPAAVHEYTSTCSSLNSVWVSLFCILLTMVTFYPL